MTILRSGPLGRQNKDLSLKILAGDMPMESNHGNRDGDMVCYGAFVAKAGYDDVSINDAVPAGLTFRSDAVP